jgi:hypothetical protein
MLLTAAVLLTVGAIAFTLLVRERDLPQPEPRTGYEHLEERKARIYEGLRDLQFEFRVGKLSEEDYQRTKMALQTELAGVLAELDAAKGGIAKPAAAKAAAAPIPVAVGTVCPHCNASFPTPLKFCGECGKAMTA